MSRTGASIAGILLLCLASPALAGAGTLVEEGVRIPLPGGAHLTADIVRPAAPGRFPVIYVHTCYGRKHVSSVAPDSPFRAELTSYDRYAYVATDWRGYPPPRGKPVDRRIDVGRDGAAAVEWIARQPWCDGKVGVWGHSAVAGAAFRIMREQPEHLVCAVPASGADGLRYEQFFYGGVLEKQHWDVGTMVGHHVLKPLLARNAYDWLWRRIDRNRKPFPSRIPTLLISGWYDTNPSLKLATFEELRSAYGEDADRVRILVGPWQHSAFGRRRQGAFEFPGAEGASGEATLRFFDRHLRSESVGSKKQAAVRFFVMGKDAWRESESWPPPTTPRTLRLTPDGGLSETAPAEPGAISWTHDPANPVPTTGGASILELSWSRTKAGPFDLRPILKRPDVKQFATGKLASEVVIAGRAQAVLHVSSDREDTDLAVWLADVGPDGRAVLVADGIRRLSFRESRSTPRPLTPGEVHEVTVLLTPTAVAFAKDHRIMLVIASSNYPRFDRHSLKAVNTLHLGPAHPGRIELPVLATPARTPVKPGLHEFGVRVSGTERSYLVHVPASASSGEPLPVVIMFHGGGGTAKAALEETGWAEKAEKAGFLAVFPEGTRADPARPARFRGNPQTWNDGSGRERVGAVVRNVDDVAFVRAMLADLEARFAVAPRRIYATGFSNGASMAFRVGRELSSQFAAIAPVAGSDWTVAAVGETAPRLLYITGTKDPLNPVDGGPIHIGGKSFGEKPPVLEFIRRWARRVGGPPEGRVRSDRAGVKTIVYGPESGASHVVLATVDGLGHHWPGGTSPLPAALAGPKSDALDATDLVWEFFSR